MKEHLESLGNYENSVKITESDVDKIGSELETTTSDETKLMQDISKNSDAYNKETGMHEAIAYATVDSESGLMEYKPMDKEVSGPSLSELLDGDSDDVLSDIKVSEETYKKAGEMFNLKDAKEALAIVGVVKRFKQGEKFDYYAELPTMLKTLAANMATGAGITKKEAAKDLLQLAAQDLELEQGSIDFIDMIKKECDLPNMTEMYAEFLQERIEVGYEKIAQQLDEAGKVEKAATYRAIIQEFKYTYGLDKLFDFANNNKSFVRKLKKEIKRWERYVTDFNYKYKVSDFSIIDISLIINSTMRSLESELTLDEAKKIMVLILKSLQNHDSTNVVEHSYAYYLIYNFITLDHVAPGSSKFMDIFRDNVLKLAQLIAFIENEKV
jgi:hypothetical protein